MPASFVLVVLAMVLGLLVCCGLIVALAAIFKGGRSKKRELSEADETRIIQELHQGLSNLEDRIETLETILLERERNKEKVK